MQRSIVMYRDARGKECICEATEYDAVWAQEPNVKLISRGTGTFDNQLSLHYPDAWTLPPTSGDWKLPQHNFGDTARGRMWSTTRVFHRIVPFNKSTVGVKITRLPNVSRLLAAWIDADGQLRFQFHIANENDRRLFDRRFVILRDGDAPWYDMENLTYEIDVGLGFICEGVYYHIYKIIEVPKVSA